MLNRLRVPFPGLKNNLHSQHISPLGHQASFSTSLMLRSFRNEKKLAGSSMPQEWSCDFEFLHIMLLKHNRKEDVESILFLVEVYEQIMLAHLREGHANIGNDNELLNNDITHFKNRVAEKLETLKNPMTTFTIPQKKTDIADEQDPPAQSFVNWF